MEWLFAGRYLISRKSHSVINIIAGVSLLAVAVPVAAMIVLLSVFNGFETLVRQMYAAVDADIEITAADSRKTDILLATEDSRRKIESCEGVEAVSFVVERQALLEYRDRQTTARVRGADDRYADVVPIGRHVSLGNAETRTGEIDRILLGEGVAYALGIFSTFGDDVSVYSLGGGAIGSMLPLSGMHRIGLPVCGMFAIDSRNDAELAITSLNAVQRLFPTGGYADAALVRVAAGHSPSKVRAALAETLGDGLKITTREEKNSAFYRIMRYEKWGVFLVSLLVLVIASFSIIGTVIMLIVEKRHERPTLRAIGADSGFIRRIFVREGLLISGIGGAAGVVLGTALAAAQQYLHVIPMPEGAFLIDSYPVELHFADIITVITTFAAVAWLISYSTARAMINNEKRCDA
jgi:hypothetical protein